MRGCCRSPSVKERPRFKNVLGTSIQGAVVDKRTAPCLGPSQRGVQLACWSACCSQSPTGRSPRRGRIAMIRKPDLLPITLPMPALPRRSADCLCKSVRSFLQEHAGSSARSELLAALEADNHCRAKLHRSRGFTALLLNMNHSCFIEVRGELITATRRRLGSRHRQ